MEQVHKDLLLRRRPQLVENIVVTGGLYNQLLQREVLNPRLVQNIKFNNTPDQQVEELLNLLPKRGADAFKYFCEALIADDQKHVVDSFLTVNNAEVTVEKSLSSSLPCPSTFTTLAVSSETTSASCTAAGPSSLTSAVTSQHNSPQKRRPVKEEKEATENLDDTGSGTETDSSPQKVKCVRSHSPSIICIKDVDDKSVFKICHPELQEKPPQLTSQIQMGNSKFSDDEIRYVLKHYVTTNSPAERRLEVNRDIATAFLADMTKEYFSLYQSSAGLHSKKLLEHDNSHYVSSPQERLVRYDSADTMERHLPYKAGPSCHQPEKEKPVTVLMPHQTTQPFRLNERNVDLTDGPVCVRVEDCNRQFFMEYKDKTGAVRNLYTNTVMCLKWFYIHGSKKNSLFSTFGTKIGNWKADVRGGRGQNIKAYRMLGMPRGQALIINVNEVRDKPPRRGTDIDRDNMHNLLTQLHFIVTVYNDRDDLTAQGLVDKLRSFAALPEHQSSDACIICLLSHGEEGYIFGTDGKRVPLDDIFLLFGNRHCPALLNKPKIFFIQACRGGALDHGVKLSLDETDGPTPQQSFSQLPSVSDMLICYPTLEGYYAWRNRERGSWYIEAVVQIFMRYAKCEDVCAMLNRVNELVSRKVSRCPQVEMDRMSQMSEFKSSLRRPYLFFFPGIGTPRVADM